MVQEGPSDPALNTIFILNRVIFKLTEQEDNNYRKLPHKKLSLLLVKNHVEPRNNNWMLPQTTIQSNYSLDELALNPVLGNVRLEHCYAEQLFTSSTTGRSPYHLGSDNIMTSYMVLYPPESDAAYEQDHMAWFDVTVVRGKVLPNELNREAVQQNIALQLKSPFNFEELSCEFILNQYEKKSELTVNNCIEAVSDLHKEDWKMILYGVERIRNKAQYTDILFNLMPKYFTITELQQVFELFLGEKLYAAQFRRTIEIKLMKQANQITEGKGHRPAQRYSYNPMWKIGL